MDTFTYIYLEGFGLFMSMISLYLMIEFDWNKKEENSLIWIFSCGVFLGIVTNIYYFIQGG